MFYEKSFESHRARIPGVGKGLKKNTRPLPLGSDLPLFAESWSSTMQLQPTVNCVGQLGHGGLVPVLGWLVGWCGSALGGLE